MAPARLVPCNQELKIHIRNVAQDTSVHYSVGLSYWDPKRLLKQISSYVFSIETRLLGTIE